MRSPIAVAENLRQLALSIRVPIPDPVEAPGTNLQLAPLAGNQVTKQMEVIALKQGEPLRQRLNNVGRRERLGENTTPSHITGINRLYLREKVAANQGTETVSADDQICLQPLAARKLHDRARCLSGKAGALITVVVGIIRKRSA